MGYQMFLSNFFPASIARRFAQTSAVRRFSRDTTGVAAVEFALIVPIALAAMLGSIEYSRAVIMSRKFNLVTAMASDLIAREDFMDPAKMVGIENAVKTVWGPNNLGNLQLQVVAVRAASSTATVKAPGTTYVDWAYPLLTATTPYVGGTVYPMPANMLNQGASTIVVNASYTYNTLFSKGVPGMSGTTMNWTSSSSHAPRNLCVGFPTASCLSKPGYE
jgi:Flp pilus assembly protein TadG